MRESSPHLHNTYNGSIRLEEKERQSKGRERAKACDLIRIPDWDSLLHENDIDTSTHNWQKQFLEIMSECIPQRQLPRRHNLPWLNQNIVRCIHKRNIAFQKHKKSPNCNSAKRYQMLHNTVTSMIRKSRRAYFNTLTRNSFGKQSNVLANKNQPFLLLC